MVSCAGKTTMQGACSTIKFTDLPVTFQYVFQPPTWASGTRLFLLSSENNNGNLENRFPSGAYLGTAPYRRGSRSVKLVLIWTDEKPPVLLHWSQIVTQSIERWLQSFVYISDLLSRQWSLTFSKQPLFATAKEMISSRNKLLGENDWMTRLSAMYFAKLMSHPLFHLHPCMGFGWLTKGLQKFRVIHMKASFLPNFPGTVLRYVTPVQLLISCIFIFSPFLWIINIIYFHVLW